MDPKYIEERMEAFFERILTPTILGLNVEPGLGRRYQITAYFALDKTKCAVEVVLQGLNRVGGGLPLDLAGEPLVFEAPTTQAHILERIFEACADRMIHELAERFFLGQVKYFDLHGGKKITTSFKFEY